MDRKIEDAFAALLNGADPATLNPTNPDGPTSAVSAKAHDAKDKKQKKSKGDPRIIISCAEVEKLIFGDRSDPEKAFGRKRNRARRGVKDDEEWKSVDMVDSPSSASAADSKKHDESDSDGSVERISEGLSDASLVASDEDFAPESEHTSAEDSAGSAVGAGTKGSGGGVSLKEFSRKEFSTTRVRPSQAESEVNFSAMGGERSWAEKIDETPEMLVKRREGQRKAEEKEMVKSAARRAVVFGVWVKGGDDEGAERKAGRGKAKGMVEDDVVGTAGEVRRKCEAVMSGAVVEPSFAKGEWGIRWRED